MAEAQRSLLMHLETVVEGLPQSTQAGTSGLPMAPQPALKGRQKSLIFYSDAVIFSPLNVDNSQENCVLYR